MPAEEVGTAVVALIPSARGFSRLAQREVSREVGRGLSIPIVPELDRRALSGQLVTGGTPRVPVELDPLTAAFTAELRRQAAVLARGVGVAVPVSADTSRMRAGIADVRERVRVAIRPDVDVDVDRSGRAIGAELAGSIAGGLVSATGNAGASLAGGLSTVGGRMGSMLGVAAAPALVAALGPALATGGAAISAAVLAGSGLGAIFAGAFALRADPLLRQAGSEFMTTLNDTFARAAQPLRDPLIQAIGIVQDGVRAIEPQLRTMFAAIAPSVPVLADGVRGFLEAFTPGLVEAVKASAPVLEQIAFVLPDLGDAAATFLSAMAQIAPEAALLLGFVGRRLADIIRIAGIGITIVGSFFDNLFFGLRTAWHAAQMVADGFGILASAVTGDLSGLRAAFDGFVSVVTGAWRRLWESVLPGSTRSGSGLVGAIVAGLPGRIRSALGDLGGLLYQAGRNVVRGLIDGIRSMFGALANAASSMAGTIRNYLPFSPAREGPLSGSGAPYQSGQAIARDLAGGMAAALPTVASAGDQLAGAVGIGGGVSARAAAAAPARLQLEWVGSDEGIFAAFREGIRVSYAGDVGLAMGS